MSNTITDWRQHPNLVSGDPAHPDFPSGAWVRSKRAFGINGIAAGTVTQIYFIQNPNLRYILRIAALDHHPSFDIDGDVDGRTNGWSALPNLHDFFDIVEAPAEGPTPPPPTFTWVSNDLKNLVHQHPRAEITRGLIRKLYDAVVPTDLTTGEEIEAWALEKGLSKTVARPVSTQQNRRTAAPERTITITATITGTESGTVTITRPFTSVVDVEVPFSVFEDGTQAVRDYVRDEAYERMWNDVDYDEEEISWHSAEWADSDYDSPDFDIGDAVEEYEEATAEEDEEEEDED
jgi:hypothetical protein